MAFDFECDDPDCGCHEHFDEANARLAKAAPALLAALIALTSPICSEEEDAEVHRQAADAIRAASTPQPADPSAPINAT